MTPTEQAARWLADVTRWTKINGQEIVGSPLLDEAQALAAIARRIAPGDDLVAQAGVIAHKLRTVSPDWLTEDGADTITALLARISALTATVAEVTRERDEATAGMFEWVKKAEKDAADNATLRARLARMEAAGRDAAEDWEECLAHVLAILGEKPDWYDHEAQAVAEFRAALTDGGSNG